MLGHKAGFSPALPDIKNPDRFFLKTGEAESCPQYLSASLTVTSVNLDHILPVRHLMIRFILLASNDNFSIEHEKTIASEEKY